MLRSVKSLALATLLLAPLCSVANPPVQRRSLSCEQLIVFDDRSGKMKGDWGKKLDTLAKFYAFGKATTFVGTFYVATHEEYSNPRRKAQKSQVEKALQKREIPLGRVEFEVPDATSHVHRPRGYSLPYVVISARVSLDRLDTRELPKCW